MPANPSLGLFFTDEFVEVSRLASNGIGLAQFNRMPLPAGLVQNGEIKNSNTFAQILQKLFQTAQPGPISFDEEIVIGINDSRVFLRIFSVPNIAGKNINDAIEYQAHSLLQVLPGDMETDWQIIGKDDNDQIEVLLVAVPRNIIEACVTSCTAIGLRVVAVEPAVFANVRIINSAQLQGKNQLLVYIGENFGEFSYLTSGNPRFSEFLSQSEIEKSGGLLQTVLTHINYANSKQTKRPIQEIIVSGSSSNLNAIITSLTQDKILVSKAISRIIEIPPLNLPSLCTSQGLSLKTLINHNSVNILPFDFRLEMVRQKLTENWKMILDVLIVFTIASLIGLFYFYQNVSEQLIRLTKTRDINNQQLTLPASQDLIKQADEINKISNRLVALRETTGGEERMLQELSAITPEGVILTSLVVTRNPVAKNFIDSSSWVMTGTAKSRELVLAFFDDLIKFPEYKEGQLYFGSLEKSTELTFRIASRQQK